MNKKIIVGGIVGTLVILTVGAIAVNNYILKPISEIQTELAINNLLETLVQNQGNECLSNSYKTYSSAWNKQCFSRGEQAECLLPLYERIDLTMEYSSDRIECLIEVN